MKRMKRMSGTGRRGWREDPDEDSINAILIAEMMQTKPDEGDREAPLKDETRRRREDEGKDEAEGESRRRKPKTKSTTGQEEEEEEEEEAAQRRTMPACHRKIR